MKKKTICLLLALITVLSVLPLTAHAARTDLAAQGEKATCKMSLQQLMKKFPQGKYWNHKVTKGNGNRYFMDPNNNPDGWSNTPCYSHKKNPIPTGEYKCNAFGAIQCAGFAGKIAYDAYGSSYLSWKTYDVRKCKPGDVITYRHFSTTGIVTSHTFMVIGREGDKIRIGECNYDRHCQITWDRYNTVSYYTPKKVEAVCYCAPQRLRVYPLETPELKPVKSEADGMTVSWSKVDGAAKYRVYYKDGSQKSWKAAGDTKSTSYRFKNAVYQTKYTFTVRAMNAKGKFASAYDAKGVSAAYLFAPNLTVAASGKKIVGTWDKVRNAALYRVYIKGGKYAKYTKLKDTDQLTYRFTGAVIGTKYTLAVRAMDAKKRFVSDASSKSAVLLLAAPAISDAACGEEGITLRWNALKGAVKYRVFKKNGSSWKKLADTNTTTYTDTDVEYGNTYQYTVRAISADGKTYTSEYSKVGRAVEYAAPAVPAETEAAQ